MGPWYSDDDHSSLSYGGGWGGGQPPVAGDMWEFIPASRCLHIKNAKFPRQYRGLPVLLTSIPHAFRIGLMELSELSASIESVAQPLHGGKIDPRAAESGADQSGRAAGNPANPPPQPPAGAGGAGLDKSGGARLDRLSPAASRPLPTAADAHEILYRPDHKMSALHSAHPNPNFPGQLEAGLGGVAAAMGMPLALLRSDFREHNMSSLNVVLRMAESRFSLPHGAC